MEPTLTLTDAPRLGTIAGRFGNHRSGLGDQPARWRRASYRQIPAATETFRLSGSGGRVVGIDASRAHVDQARRRWSGRTAAVEVLVGDARRMPFTAADLGCTAIDSGEVAVFGMHSSDFDEWRRRFGSAAALQRAV